MKILHVVSLINASTGGPAVSVTRLASEQAAVGHDVALVCLDYPHLGPAVEAPGVRLVSVPGTPLAVWGRGWSPALRRTIFEEARRADVVHNHGLWMWPNACARQAAAAAGRPLVISPRGMLDTWSLRRSRLRKAVAWRLFEKRNLESAALFHVTSAHEEGNVRDAGLSQPVVMAPNGIDLPVLASKPPRADLEHRWPRLRGARWVVFLSRLHPKKGLDVLVQAWAQLRRGGASPDAVLVIAGPDLTGYRGEVEGLIAAHGLGDSVVLTGEVRGRDKDVLLGHAEVFVLPSYSENFGIVIGEAMAWARPVIASKATPWGAVADVGAGWWVEPRAETVAAALEDALGRMPEELDRMGASARRLVETQYTWPGAAARVTAACKTLL